MLEFARQKLQQPAEGLGPFGAGGVAVRRKTLIIGDRMDTDILCGLEAGMDTVLVMSGVTTAAEVNKFAFRPTIILNGILDVKDQ